MLTSVSPELGNILKHYNMKLAVHDEMRLFLWCRGSLSSYV